MHVCVCVWGGLLGCQVPLKCCAEGLYLKSFLWRESAEMFSAVKCLYDRNPKDKPQVENIRDNAGSSVGVDVVAADIMQSPELFSSGREHKKVCLLMSTHDIIGDYKTSRHMT